MEYLKKNGYRVLSLSEFKRCFLHKNCPEKSILITVDDGYKSTMKAFEVFSKYGFPFVVFLYLEAVGRYPDFLSAEDIRKFQRSGLVEFGSHSYSHFSVAKMACMPEEERKGFFERDIERAEKRFRRLLGEKPSVFAYPYGEYSRELIEVLKKRGYEFAFTQDLGVVGNCTDRYLIPRIPVVGSWSSKDRFVQFLKLGFLCVNGTIPYGVVENPVVVGPFDAPYRNCYLYSTLLGWIKKKKAIFHLKRGRNRVGVVCVDRGVKRMLLRTVIPKEDVCP